MNSAMVVQEVLQRRRVLKMRNGVAGHQKLTMTNWELTLFQLHNKLLKNSVLTVLWSFSIWSKLERWKSSIAECLMSWLQKKNCFEALSSLILHNNYQPFLDQTVMCDKKWISYDNRWWPAQWLDWEEAPKHFPKQICTKEKSWSLVVCCQSNPLQLSESCWNHYLWEVCSANWRDAPKTVMPAVCIGQQKGPNSSPWQCPMACRTTNASKVDWTGLWSFASSALFTWPLAN